MNTPSKAIFFTEKAEIEAAIAADLHHAPLGFVCDNQTVFVWLERRGHGRRSNYFGKRYARATVGVPRERGSPRSHASSSWFRTPSPSPGSSCSLRRSG